MIVRVVPYDPAWPRLFAAERDRLETALGHVVVALHHIGSTAVPCLAAKPIIDFLLEVTSLAALDERSQDLEALGYEAKGDFGIAGRRYFRRDDAAGIRTHQIHAFAHRNGNIPRHLAFRDYLIAHPDVAELYGELKYRLAAAHPNDIDAYSAGKNDFVKTHEASALSWRGSCAPRADKQDA